MGERIRVVVQIMSRVSVLRLVAPSVEYLCFPMWKGERRRAKGVHASRTGNGKWEIRQEWVPQAGIVSSMAASRLAVYVCAPVLDTTGVACGFWGAALGTSTTRVLHAHGHRVHSRPLPTTNRATATPSTHTHPRPRPRCCTQTYNKVA